MCIIEERVLLAELEIRGNGLEKDRVASLIQKFRMLISVSIHSFSDQVFEFFGNLIAKNHAQCKVDEDRERIEITSRICR